MSWKHTLLASSIALALTGCGSGEEESTSAGSSNSAPAAASISLSRSTLDATEGNSGTTPITLTLSATRVLETDVKIAYLTEDGTAKAGVDYESASGEITMLKGTRTADFTVNVLGNTIHQSMRDFSVVLSTVTGTNASKGNISTTTIRVQDDDPEPTVSMATVRSNVPENIGSVDVVAKLDRQSEKATTVRFTLAGLAIKDIDYQIPALEFTIPAMATSAAIPVKIEADNIVEGTENIVITLSSVVNGKLGTAIQSTLFINGDLKLPDTGVTLFYNNGNFNSNAPDSNHPYQDASFGLDTDPSYNQNGYAGFVYQKIDNAGNALASSATNHSCVYDNHSGLTWQVLKDVNLKPDTGDATAAEAKLILEAFGNTYWGSKNHVYLWSNSDAKTNGGSAGGANSNEFTNNIYVSENCAFPARGSNLDVAPGSVGCTSTKIVELVNKAALCGFKDWRLPSATEITSIVNYESNQTFLDADYYRDMNSPWTSGMKYLTSSPSNDNDASVWCLNADSKSLQLCNKQTYNHVRLVRGSKL